MKNFLSNYFKSYDTPFDNAWKYTLIGLLFSLCLSVVSIFLIWFLNTPIFDFKGFLFKIIEELIKFKAPIILAIVSILFLCSVFTKNTGRTILYAFAIKLVTSSYLVLLITICISTAIVKNSFFEGEWLFKLPFSSEYPIMTVLLIIAIWFSTWYMALRMRLKRKEQFIPTENEQFIDVVVHLQNFFANKK
ncbi:hypothetical protein [Pseudoalteromonas sp. ZZD1]|uniref:hypothetical protein n=1 Tax=Pseudoalteromonas sp. ZZD1 TaxID=3139395 RepID=UPI003BAD72C6